MSRDLERYIWSPIIMKFTKNRNFQSLRNDDEDDDVVPRSRVWSCPDSLIKRRTRG